MTDDLRETLWRLERALASADPSSVDGGLEALLADGFLEFYGDYGEIAITSEGKTIGVWAEAFSYNGPGGVWFNRQT